MSSESFSSDYYPLDASEDSNQQNQDVIEHELANTMPPEDKYNLVKLFMLLMGL